MLDGYTGASRPLVDEQREDSMWCIVYIAMAGAAPAAVCNIGIEEVCRNRAASENNINWKPDSSKISYLAKCVTAKERQRMQQAEQLKKVQTQ